MAICIPDLHELVFPFFVAETILSTYSDNFATYMSSSVQSCSSKERSSISTLTWHLTNPIPFNVQHSRLVENLKSIERLLDCIHSETRGWLLLFLHRYLSDLGLHSPTHFHTTQRNISFRLSIPHREINHLSFPFHIGSIHNW